MAPEASGRGAAAAAEKVVQTSTPLAIRAEVGLHPTPDHGVAVGNAGCSRAAHRAMQVVFLPMANGR